MKKASVSGGGDGLAYRNRGSRRVVGEKGSGFFGGENKFCRVQKRGENDLNKSDRRSWGGHQRSRKRKGQNRLPREREIRNRGCVTWQFLCILKRGKLHPNGSALIENALVKDSERRKIRFEKSRLASGNRNPFTEEVNCS